MMPKEHPIVHLHIGHLYPFSMNTYGDTGNILCLQQRAAWRGIETTVHRLEIGDPIPERIDLYFFGGGQDAAQEAAGEDLLKNKGSRLLADFAAGTPFLAICGGYQLLGQEYLPHAAPPIPGLGLFPVVTAASSDRMIGDLVVETDPRHGIDPLRPTVVGFENHSGKTTLQGDAARPLGRVIHGSGNNGADKQEGCIIKNALGCYLHGSLLPKNPHVADWLLLRAGRLRKPDFSLESLDDSLELTAHDHIVSRYA